MTSKIKGLGFKTSKKTRMTSKIKVLVPTDKNNNNDNNVSNNNINDSNNMNGRNNSSNRNNGINNDSNRIINN
jgi:hypothetical protein